MIAERLEQILAHGALELRGDGRAGSGVVLTMQSIASTAIADPSLHVQEWPFFSSARKGAPTRGFLRLSRRPIEKASQVTHPHIAMMVDEGVSAFVDFAQGVPPGGIFVINTPLTPEAAAEKYRLTGRVYTIDGNTIAMQHLKQPLGNISLFALLCDILPGLSAEAGREHLEILLTKRRLPRPLIESNGNLFMASVGVARHADCVCGTTTDHHVSPFRGYGELAPGAQSRLRLSRTNLTSAYARTGFQLHFSDPDGLCNGCGHCIINCPENIISFRPDAATGVRVTGAEISRYCKLCNECIAVCPKKLFSEIPILHSQAV